jgi:two-component system, cell cycle response regulator
MKVLVAEDNLTMRIMVAGIIGRWGHQPVQAADGEESWQILVQPDAPRMALLDWEMPKMDGIEVCCRLREREKRGAAYTYVIMLTSHDEKQEIIAGIEAGADDYVIKPFDQHELRARMRAGSRIIDLQIELLQRKEEYRQLSRTVPLTGCFNRRSILERLVDEMMRAKQKDRIIGVSMMDIDHFKYVNDSHGHGAGDDVLREFVLRLGQTMCAQDAFGRIGGEEFLAVWISDGGKGVIAANERFRFMIENTPFRMQEIDLPITVSIGVTSTYGDESIDAVIARVDQALYSAKEKGRNRVECAQLSIPRTCFPLHSPTEITTNYGNASIAAR